MQLNGPQKLANIQLLWITSASGNCGAVREVCEALLKARGIREKIIIDVENDC